jgi:DNA-binding Lrp family transcriptional regulator
MPTRALSMRKIRELIRLKYEARLSHEQIAGALSISKGVVAKYVARIERAGLEPKEMMALPDAQVLARITPAPRPASYGGRIAPDFAHVHAELKRPSVTLMLLWQEYTSANADGRTYRYSQFTDLYRDYVATLRRSMRQVHRAGEKLFVDYAGQSVPYGREGDRAQIFVAALGRLALHLCLRHGASASHRLDRGVGAGAGIYRRRARADRARQCPGTDRRSGSL